MNILDIMTKEIIKVAATTSLADAINLMQENQVRHLIVIAGDGSLVGIVSDRDLRLAAQSPYAIYAAEKSDKFAEKVLIEQVMTQTPYCVFPQYSVSEVAHLLIEHHISAVPVLQDGDLVGIVTSTDLLKVLATQPI